MKKLFFPVILLLFFIFSSGCSKEESVEPKAEIPKPVKTKLIGKTDDVLIREFPGKVEANKDVELNFQVSGRLIEFPVIKGQEIKKGALIARLDQTDFKLKVNEAKANRDEAKLSFERSEDLYAADHISKSEYDSGKAKYEVAKAQLDLAKQNLGYTVLRAPFAGRIANTFPDTHQYIQEKEPIALLQNLGRLDIAFDVPENIVIHFENRKIIKKVAIFDAAPSKEYPVNYKTHVTEADPATQTYRVNVWLTNPPDLSVLPGMTATVKIEFVPKEKSGEGQSTFLIPSSAVFADEKGKPFVWKIDSESFRVHSSPVVTGELLENQIRVVQGLTPGDQIVAAGVYFLREKQLVRPTSQDEAK